MAKQHPDLTDLTNLLDAMAQSDWAETFHEFHKPLRGLYVRAEMAALRLLWAYLADPVNAVADFCTRPQAFGDLLPANKPSKSADVAQQLLVYELAPLDQVARALQNHAKLVEKLNAFRKSHPELMDKAEAEHRIRETATQIRLLTWFDAAVDGALLNGEHPEDALRKTSLVSKRKAIRRRRLGRARQPRD